MPQLLSNRRVVWDFYCSFFTVVLGLLKKKLVTPQLSRQAVYGLSVDRMLRGLQTTQNSTR